MKPEDLPFYNVPLKGSDKNEETKNSEVSILEPRVRTCRLFLEDRLKPLQSELTRTNKNLQGWKQKYIDLYLRLNTPENRFNSSIILGSAAGGWMLNAIIFPKSGWLRRILTPTAFGAVGASILYSDTTLRLCKEYYKLGSDKFFELTSGKK